MVRLAALSLLLIAASPAVAQRQLTTPRVSPHGRVMQTVGMTDLSVDYHRPAVNGRTVWGELVPYGDVWRAGANENTTFETSTDISVQGETLPAGRYGFHVIPAEGEWTVVFSAMADAWGSYFYDASEDVLRVTASPRDGAMQERLAFRFDDPDLDSATLVLHWDRLELPIAIAADTPSLVLDHMERELHGVPGFFAEGWEQIATYALDNGLRTEDALQWAENSIQRGAAFGNQMTKARALDALGQTSDATALRAAALSVAEEEEVEAYAQSRRRAGHADEADRVLALYRDRG